MSGELKPCPFCGDEAEICIRYENPTTEMYVVKCINCGATSTPATLFKDRAIEIWNENAEAENE